VRSSDSQRYLHNVKRLVESFQFSRNETTFMVYPQYILPFLAFLRDYCKTKGHRILEYETSVD